MRRRQAFLHTVPAALLLALTSAALGQGAKSDVSFLYGVWKIQSVSEVGGHAAASGQLAEKEIGREIEFRQKSMSYEERPFFLRDSCTRAKYRIKTQKVGKYDVGEKGTLEFYDLGPRRPGWIETVIVKCANGDEYWFERAQGKRLAIYYDGWFFFLQNVAS